MRASLRTMRKLPKRPTRSATLFVTALASAGVATSAASAFELRLPVACELGSECFIQQYPDTDPTSGAQDPFCGNATYDTHDGTDIRVRSLPDMERGVAVVAAADGEVLRLRDGEPDRLVVTDEDRERVADRECGNGLIIAHEGGYETQYCHLKQDSISVKPGDRVKAGQKIGEIGASGMAQFPHVHLTVRRNGKVVDPASGRAPAEGCEADRSRLAPLFAKDVIDRLTPELPDILGFGLAGEPIEHDELVVEGPPPVANSADTITLAWGWFINLRKDDRLRLTIRQPDGTELVDHTTEPVDRSKAVYSAFAGKKRKPQQGRHEVGVAVIRNGAAIVEKTQFIEVE